MAKVDILEIKTEEAGLELGIWCLPYRVLIQQRLRKLRNSWPFIDFSHNFQI
jgi:hypothetical protein